MISIDNMISMLKFLKLTSFIVPHYDIAIPVEALGVNYRSNKTFVFDDFGTLNYRGWNGNMKEDYIYIRNISFPEVWKKRTFYFLKERVETKYKCALRNTEMPKAKEISMRFNRLGFL